MTIPKSHLLVTQAHMKYLVMALAFALAYIVVASFVFAVPFDMVH